MKKLTGIHPIKMFTKVYLGIDRKVCHLSTGHHELEQTAKFLPDVPGQDDQV